MESKMKNAIQKMGKVLSGMVMPNIGAFIAWGFLTAIFLSPGGSGISRCGGGLGGRST